MCLYVWCYGTNSVFHLIKDCSTPVGTYTCILRGRLLADRINQENPANIQLRIKMLAGELVTRVCVITWTTQYTSIPVQHLDLMWSVCGLHTCVYMPAPQSFQHVFSNMTTCHAFFLPSLCENVHLKLAFESTYLFTMYVQRSENS